MNTLTKATRPIPFATDAARWQAVTQRDPAGDGAFVYAVQTTGIYCRPVCPARLPRRENVRFYQFGEEAERAGFRPCKRCRPHSDSRTERHAAVVAAACRSLEQADGPLSLDQLATAAGLSRHHFHRLFKSHTGVTPKAYETALRQGRVIKKLVEGNTVTEAIYGAGFNSSGSFYRTSDAALGMLPKTVRAGGQGVVMRFGVGECWLGAILVAATDQGVCAILMGDDPDALVRDLQDRFPKAELIGADAAFEEWMASVIGFVNHQAEGLRLPLDIQGTAFQQQVWQALQDIPAGSTRTYTEIAQYIGRPQSVRAVAQACGANPLAVAIPCHRVVRINGDLAGYRWGVERKSKLLNRERQQ